MKAMDKQKKPQEIRLGKPLPVGDIWMYYEKEMRHGRISQLEFDLMETTLSTSVWK